MISLALDTTGRTCMAALVDEGGVLAYRADDIGRGHDAHLAPMAADLLASARLSFSDIKRIGVCTGPGSFTGQRVALSFALGAALPRNIPVLGFSCFDIWAAEKDPEQQRNILCAADVRRGQLCWAYYEKGVCVRGPQTDDAAIAEALFSDMKPYERVQDVPINGAILGWLALERKPEDYLPVPLYSRPPDAKLPSKKPSSKKPSSRKQSSKKRL